MISPCTYSVFFELAPCLIGKKKKNTKLRDRNQCLSTLLREFSPLQLESEDSGEREQACNSIAAVISEDPTAIRFFETPDAVVNFFLPMF